MLPNAKSGHQQKGGVCSDCEGFDPREPHEPSPTGSDEWWFVVFFAEAGDQLRLLVVHTGPYVGRRSCQSRHPWGTPATSKDSLVPSRPAPAHTNRSTEDQTLTEYLTGSSWNEEAFFNVSRELPQVFRASTMNLPHLQANFGFGTDGETLEPGAEKKSMNLSIRPGHLRHQQRIPCPCSMQPCLSQSVGSGEHNEVELSSPSFAQKLLLLVPSCQHDQRL